MNFTQTLFAESIEKANDIFNHSENLRDANANADIYVERLPYLTDLLGERGYVSFHPFVQKDLAVDFRAVVAVDRESKYDALYGQRHDNWDAEQVARNEWILADKLTANMTSENLVANTIPQRVLNAIREYEIKGYNSPKLSKVLVKLFGENSDVVKWFTNECPKNLDKGLNTDYKVHLSILPHHIAGMAYYAPYNTGGKRWITGWEGTSCMDTIKNATGNGIYQLVPNMLDSTLAVAFITEDGEDDLFNPVYHARSLVRIAKVNDTDYAMVGLRPFYTTNEVKSLLFEGLKNEFENFISVESIKNDYQCEDTKRFSTVAEVLWSTQGKEDCDSCEGSGTDYDDGTCSDCEGKGYILSEGREYLPYIDDPDTIRIDTDMVHCNLPIKWLVEKGFMEKPEKKVLPTPNNNLFFAC